MDRSGFGLLVWRPSFSAGPSRVSACTATHTVQSYRLATILMHVPLTLHVRALHWGLVNAYVPNSNYMQSGGPMGMKSLRGLVCILVSDVRTCTITGDGIGQILFHIRTTAVDVTCVTPEITIIPKPP